MAKIDCFLVGHNELSIAKAKRMLLYLYGKGSHEYRDRSKYTFSQLTLNNRRYSPITLYNHIRRESGATAENDLSIITESFNLAVACLGSELNRAGLSFDFINGFQEEKDRLREYLVANEVRSVAIITTYYLSHFPIHDIVSFIRSFDRNVKIIVGGPYVINKLAGMEPEKISELFETIGADYYVKDSFGEDVLVDLVKCIAADREPVGIRNVYYRQDGEFRCANPGVKGFDFLKSPVDWNLFAERLVPVVNVRTAVSCPYKCAFCNFPAYAGKYTLSPLDACERELRTLYERGVRYVQFIDDTFNVPKGRFKDLLRMMIRNRFGFQWNSYFKCQYVDEETVALMKESGCQFVFLGIESGSQTILDNMNKRTTTAIYRQCLELFRKYDIMTMCSVIVGFPGETQETFRETFDFIEECRPTFFQQRLWWSDRMAPIHLQREKYGIEGEGYAWRHATMDVEEAHDRADELFLKIEGSIHITEYVLPFFLLERGLSRENVKGFLRNYMFANREQFLRPDVEADPRFIEGIYSALGQKRPQQLARPALAV